MASFRLLKKDCCWYGSEVQAKKIQALKDAFTSAPILAFPYFNMTFTLQCAASFYCSSSVLMQVLEDQERLIAYASRILNDAGYNCTATEKECFASVRSLQKLRKYLESCRFTAITDHSSLKCIYQQHNPMGRVAQWAKEVLRYDLNVIHRQVALHHVPDGLPRMFESEIELLIAMTETRDQWYVRTAKAIETHPKLFKDWTVPEGKIYYHREDPLLESLTIEDLDE